MSDLTVIGSGGSQDIDLHFDTAGLVAGECNARLCFASNADDPLYPVPVTLTIQAAPSLAIFANGFE